MDQSGCISTTKAVAAVPGQIVGGREKAWQIARQAARLLREQFHVSRVVVFGSLTREEGFTRWSTVDRFLPLELSPQVEETLLALL